MKRKNRIAGCMALLLALTVAVISPAEGKTALAASDVPQSITYEKLSVQDEAPTKDGYLFGGWYEDEKGETVIKDTEGISQAYAKFVPAYVLSVKAQNYAATERATQEDTILVNTTTTRLVTTVDSGDYKEVGFEIIKKDGTVKTGEINKVYRQLQVGTTDYNAYQVFGESAEYFAVLALKNIPQSAWDQDTYVRPYWVTMDGTKVTGLGKYVRVDDGIDGYISVPINLKTGEAIAAGLVCVSYDKSALEYAGYVAGKVFTEMTADEKDGIITCVGNVSVEGTTLQNTEADNLYISLRFKNKSHNVGNGNFLTFTVTGENFCNVDEKDVSLNVWDVQY